MLLSAGTLNQFVEVNQSMVKSGVDVRKLNLQELDYGIAVIRDYEKEQQMMVKTR